MRAVAAIIRRFGPAHEVVTVEDAPIVPPGAGEVVVRMMRSAVNPSDLITVSGAYRSRTPLPFRPGYEGVGTIVERGPGGVGPAIGTRVLPIGSAGTWSTHKTLAADWCVPVSPDLPLDQAATMYVNPCTAWLMLHERATIEPRRRVVVSAAASEIGRMLVRLLNRLGVEPVVTVRQMPSARDFGGMRVSRVLASDGEDFPSALAEAVGDGADLVLDAVGGSVGAALVGALRPGGRFIHYGLLSGTPLPSEAWRAPGIRVELFSLRNWIHAAPRRDVAALLGRVEPLVADGTLASRIEAAYPLAEIRTALARAAGSSRRGKVLLGPGGSPEAR